MKNSSSNDNEKLFKEIFNLGNLAHNDMSWAKKNINRKLNFITLLVFALNTYILMSVFDFFQLANGLNNLLAIIISAWLTLFIWFFKIKKSTVQVDDYLDSLLTKYQPNDKDAFQEFTNKTKENPTDFYMLLYKWIDIEADTYRKNDYKEKKYNFTEKS
ncbi:TPA: hypothetical protein ACS7ZV_003549 [Providencia alcalifaciens]